MSGVKVFPIILLYLTWIFTSFRRRLTRWSSSASNISFRSESKMPLSMVSNALDMSSMSRCASRSFAHSASSVRTLKVKTNSVVLRPGL